MRKIIWGMFCCILIFAGVASPAGRGERAGSRCVACYLDPQAVKETCVVWCDGGRTAAKIYPSLQDAAAYAVGGHCVHLACLKLYFLRAHHKCPVCKRSYSPEARATILGFDAHAFNGAADDAYDGEDERHLEREEE